MSYDLCGKEYGGFLGKVRCVRVQGHSGHCESERPWLDGTKFVRDHPLNKWQPQPPFYKRRKSSDRGI